MAKISCVKVLTWFSCVDFSAGGYASEIYCMMEGSPEKQTSAQKARFRVGQVLFTYKNEMDLIFFDR